MINNRLFKLNEVPSFHPLTQKYDRISFWKSEKRKCMEGYWVSGKWMPGELYYYINFHHIIVEDGVYRGLSLPWLRDIDWEEFYIYTEAIGFSGFEEDNKESCHRGIIEYNEDTFTKEDVVNKYCKNKDGEVDRSMYNNIFNDKGDFKKYVNARDYLKRIHKKSLGKPLYYNQAKHLLLLGSRGFGKDLHEDTIVHSKHGPLKIKDVKVGLEIYGRDGKLTKITSRNDYNDQMQYKITTKDGRSLIAGGGHLWGVIDRYGKNKVKSTLDILNDYKTIRPTKGVDYHYFLPMCEPLEYEEKDLKIDPYFLGLWLGDGNSNRVGITTIDKEISDFIYEYADINNCKVTVNQNANKTCPTYHITKGNVGDHSDNILLQEFKRLNLFNNKHIPDINTFSSVNQRMELLRGMMDSDGYCGKKGQIEFATSSDLLHSGFVRLLDSLGIKNNSEVRITKCNGKEFLSYRVKIITSLPIFKLDRKLSRINNSPSKYAIANRTKTAIVNIEEVEVKPSVCIGVDNEDKLFVAGERFIVTHNSYSTSGFIAHNYLFDGSHDYDYYLSQLELKKLMRADSVVGAIDAKFSGDLLGKVKVAFEHLPDSHSINSGRNTMYDPSPLMKDFTGSMASGKDLISTRSKSTIHHRTFQDNPLAANGTRPNRVFIDEVGFMNNLLETWEAIEATQAAAQFKRLTIFGMGTGGLTSGGAAMYSHEIFYNPAEYGCLVFDDIWEDRGSIGYFMPATKALNEFKSGDTLNKITNEEKAAKAIDLERDEAKRSPTRTKYMGTVINKPILPSEIFLRMEGSFFPVQDLKIRLSELEVRDSILSATYKYDFNIIGGKVSPSVSNKPVIREFPLRKGFDMDAAVEIIERPKHNQDGLIPSGRYIAGWDVVENDGNEDVQQSLQSIFIMDSWTERIVAEYTSRTYLAEDYYETARRLLIFYNAKCNYESNIKGPYAYFKNKNALHILVETPEILKDQNLLKGSTIGNKALGTNTNDRIVNWGLSLILSWLEKQAYGRDDGVRNIETIFSPGLLKELIAYSKDINTDRVSALIMLMILKEDTLRATELSKTKSIKIKTSDKFWDKAFKKRR